MNNYHVIKDPVHGVIQFTEAENHWVKPFIDSPNFQRLRHIKQLGLADWIFPGAVHTRFNHSLGCAYVASQISEKLHLSTQDKQKVVLAGLLHDIGHGPFSHTFEELFYQKCLRHEDWTPLFLQEYADTGLLEHHPETQLTTQTFLSIQNLIMHQEKNQKLLADIVSSQLDADRLDYLLRDSHFCGVSYGQYDFAWLLHCLMIVEQEGQQRLGITVKGVGVVEHYLMARRLMMKNVYHHAKKYTAEFLLTLFLKYLAQELAEHPQFKNLHSSHLSQFLVATMKFNQAIENSPDSTALKQEFLKTHYPLYKKLCDYDVFAMIRTLAESPEIRPVITIAKLLESRQIPRGIICQESQVAKAREYLAALEKKVQPWQAALLTLPHQSYQAKKDPILLVNALGNIETIHDHSLMIRALSDRQEFSYLICLDESILHLPEAQALCHH